MYPTVLPRPPYLNDFHGLVKVRIRYDNRNMCLQQACGPVELPEGLPVAPLVTFEALDSAGRLIFPIQVWDDEADRGRGGWTIYDEKLFPVPESKPEVEPEPEPKVSADQIILDDMVEDSGISLSSSTKVESESAVRPSDELDEDVEVEDDD